MHRRICLSLVQFARPRLLSKSVLPDSEHRPDREKGNDQTSAENGGV